MTDRDFNYLSQYEDNLRTAVRSGWARNPGRSALQGIYDIVHETEQLPRFNPGCASCVLSILQKAGKLYFAEKERREAEAKKAAESAKTAQEQAVKTETKPAPKKTAKPRKSKSKTE